MIGLSIIYNAAGEKIDGGLIGMFSNDAKMPNCNREVLPLSPSLWVQHVFRPVTAAPGGVISTTYGHVHLVFHGEVYNSPELAEYLGTERPTIKSIADGPELVAIGIEHEGMQFVERINGSFVLLAWHPKDKMLYLANDRYGLRPHYYGWDGKTLFIAPNVSAIYRTWNRQTRIDRESAVEFFAFEHITGNKTMVADISLLPPALIAKCDRAEIKMKTYWDFPYPEPALKYSELELREELKRRLIKAINRQIPTNSSLGVPLSGGLDSRTLAAVASQSVTNLPVFTFGHSNCADRRFAAMVASEIGAAHYCASPENADFTKNFHISAKICEGMSSVMHAHILMLHSIIADKVDVVLDGFAGDLIFGSSIKRCMLTSFFPADLTNWLMINAYNRTFLSSELKTLFVDKTFQGAIQLLDEVLQKRVEMCQSVQLAHIVNYVKLREHVRRFTINGNTLLRNIVEVRTPFFDYDLIDFAISMPVRLMFEKRLYKDAVRELLPELRHVPYTPAGENLKHTCTVSNMRRVFRRPDTILRSYMPKTVKNYLHQVLQNISSQQHDKGVNYNIVLGSDLLALFPMYSDHHRGWEYFTSYNVIEEILAKAASDNSMKQASKLSVWLTFQMYREISGIET